MGGMALKGRSSFYAVLHGENIPTRRAMGKKGDYQEKGRLSGGRGIIRRKGDYQEEGELSGGRGIILSLIHI